jgi:RNA polymerase sigma factor for flagellar operon FliA
MSEVLTRDDLIRELFPLVKKIAHRVRRMVPSSDVDDLIGDGCIGLIRAVDTFDPARGSFERYAPRIITGAMLNGVRRLDPVSERVRREMRAAQRDRYDIAAHAHAVPSQREMEQRRPALKRAALHAYRYAPLSLDSILPLGERLRVDWSDDPALICSDRAERGALRAALTSLPPRQRYVVCMHYFNRRTMLEIGRTLSITPQRASQLHLAGLRKLRKAMHGAH